MKKIILVVILLLGICPFFENKTLSITGFQKLNAQNWGGSGGSCPWQTGVYNLSSGSSSSPSAVGNLLRKVVGLFKQIAVGNGETGGIKGFIKNIFGKNSNNSGGEDDGESMGDEENEDNDEEEELAPEIPDDFDHFGEDEIFPYDPFLDYDGTPIGIGSEDYGFIDNFVYHYSYYAYNLPTPNANTYYLKINNDTTKYWYGQKIYLSIKDTIATFTLYNSNGNPVPLTNLTWHRKGNGTDTIKCTGTVNCNYSRNVEGKTTLKIDSVASTGSASFTYMKNDIIIYDKPTIVFERETNYLGNYGWDTSGHKYPQLRNDPKYAKGYEIRRVNTDPNYEVPWLGLPDSTSAKVKLKKIGLSSDVKKDLTFRVTLKPSSNNIKLNGQNELTLTATQLDNLDTLRIYSTEWDANADSLKIVGNIVAITNSGDTIGKINVSCVKLQRREIQFVNVKANTSYYATAVNRANTLAITNLYMRGLFRYYEEIHRYADTLDISSDYSINPLLFDSTNKDSLLKRIKRFYKIKNGVDPNFLMMLSAPTGSYLYKDRVRVYFLLNNLLNYNVLGQSYEPGGMGYICPNATITTLAHEIGHSAKLAHTFSDPDAINYAIPKGTTRNIMDYTNYHESFWFSQWVDIDK